MQNETPMIWTAKGNLPLADLGDPEVIWERTDTYVKINIIHRLNGELVRQEAHVLALQPLTFETQTGSMN